MLIFVSNIFGIFMFSVYVNQLYEIKKLFEIGNLLNRISVNIIFFGVFIFDIVIIFINSKVRSNKIILMN